MKLEKKRMVYRNISLSGNSELKGMCFSFAATSKETNSSSPIWNTILQCFEIRSFRNKFFIWDDKLLRTLFSFFLSFSWLPENDFKAVVRGCSMIFKNSFPFDCLAKVIKSASIGAHINANRCGRPSDIGIMDTGTKAAEFITDSEIEEIILFCNNLFVTKNYLEFSQINFKN